MKKHAKANTEKELIDIIRTPKDEETIMRRNAKRLVRENNIKEKTYKWHFEEIQPRGRKIVFDRDKKGNLIPKK